MCAFLFMCTRICQVSQLYDVVQKWDAVSTSVPQVVQRLVAVKELHEQGETQEVIDRSAVKHLLRPFTYSKALKQFDKYYRSIFSLVISNTHASHGWLKCSFILWILLLYYSWGDFFTLIRPKAVNLLLPAVLIFHVSREKPWNHTQGNSRRDLCRLVEYKSVSQWLNMQELGTDQNRVWTLITFQASGMKCLVLRICIHNGRFWVGQKIKTKRKWDSCKENEPNPCLFFK